MKKIFYYAHASGLVFENYHEALKNAIECIKMNISSFLLHGGLLSENFDLNINAINSIEKVYAAYFVSKENGTVYDENFSFFCRYEYITKNESVLGYDEIDKYRNYYYRIPENRKNWRQKYTLKYVE
jgi:hypothetical protein